MDTSPFRKLPAELRLDIFERCLWTEGGVTIDFRSGKKAARIPGLGITVACRKSHAETAPLILTINDVRFEVDGGPHTARRMRRWLARNGTGPISQRRCLRTIFHTNKLVLDVSDGTRVLRDVARSCAPYPKYFLRPGIQHRLEICTSFYTWIKRKYDVRPFEIDLTVSKDNEFARAKLEETIREVKSGPVFYGYAAYLTPYDLKVLKCKRDGLSFIIEAIEGADFTLEGLGM